MAGKQVDKKFIEILFELYKCDAEMYSYIAVADMNKAKQFDSKSKEAFHALLDYADAEGHEYFEKLVNEEAKRALKELICFCVEVIEK